MTDERLFLAASVQPVCLAALEPAVSPALPASGDARPAAVSPCAAEEQDLFDATPPDPQTRSRDASGRILRVCAAACARWFSVVRECIRRERTRQQLFREGHGLPKSARIPYERQPLTAAEEAVAAYSEAIVRSLFGDGPADYAHEKFRRAVETGDMRAFKIRLLLIKARDSLRGNPLYGDFLEGLESCISDAEEQAGCTPDPSPRRLSRMERERRKSRDAHKAALREQQIELPLIWPGEENPAIANVEAADEECHSSPDSNGCGDRAKKTPPNCESSSPEASSSGNDGRGDISLFAKNGKNDNISPEARKRERGYISVKKPHKRESEAESGVTVTCTVKKSDFSGGHKRREYDSVEQILEDVYSGRIVPYQSTKEICRDVEAGNITEVEALMFTMAMDQYKPTSPSETGSELDLENDFAQADVGDDGIDEGGDDDDADAYDESPSRYRPVSRFSYNPRGFCGCEDGHYSDYGTDWNADDE